MCLCVCVCLCREREKEREREREREGERVLVRLSERLYCILMNSQSPHCVLLMEAKKVYPIFVKLKTIRVAKKNPKREQGYSSELKQSVGCKPSYHILFYVCIIPYYFALFRISEHF